MRDRGHCLVVERVLAKDETRVRFSLAALTKFMTENKLKLTPRDFFLYLGAMAALYTSAGSLIALFFQYIEVIFPDRLDFYFDPYSSSIRFSIASLVVVFPLYIFLVKFLNADLRRHPEKKELWIRRWLVYLTLFAAGIAVIGDLVALINTFLGGEITVRFVLKVLAVLVVALSVFGYYFLDLRGKWERESGLARWIGWLALIFVFAAVVSGFFIFGSPQTQRLMRFDLQRVADLQMIQSQVVNYWQAKEKLPVSLEDLADPLVGFAVPRDPQNDSPYGYRVVSGLTFNLCANFSRESFAPTPQVKTRPFYPVYHESVPALADDANWEHGEGEKCFERTIDPEKFPPWQIKTGR